jgi:hypothetical protein
VSNHGEETLYQGTGKSTSHRENSIQRCLDLSQNYVLNIATIYPPPESAKRVASYLESRLADSQEPPLHLYMGIYDYASGEIAS